MSRRTTLRHKTKGTTQTGEVVVETETAWQFVRSGGNRVTLVKKDEWYEYTSPTFADLFGTSTAPTNPFDNLFGARA